MTRTIILEGHEIEYEFVRKRIKNLNLRIRHDGMLYVSCPLRMPEEEVLSFIREKSSFILKGIDKTKARIYRASRPVSYIDGEKVSVFGEECVIRVIRSSKAHVDFVFPEVRLYVKDPDSVEQRKRLYETWKRKMIRDKILEMGEYYYPHFRDAGVPEPRQIKFRSMSSKWGICRPRERILTFNFNLFEVPEEAIAYVVVHEYAHFLEANHSDRFYKEVARVMPDWKPRRKLLNEY